MSRKEYRTDFATPEGATCFEQGGFGERDYQRALTAEEAALVASQRLAEAEERLATDLAERNAYFDALRARLKQRDKPRTASKRCAGTKRRRGVKSSPGP